MRLCITQEGIMFNKMNAEIKAKWIASLRSGQYIQGHKHLCTVVDGTKRWCCLGVLFEVVGVKPVESSEKDFLRYSYKDDYPSSMNIGAKFSNDVGMSLDTADQLITFNDDERRDFNFIANWIDANL
jgi:hypothetical protein